MTDGIPVLDVGFKELQNRFLRYAIAAAEHDEQQSCVQAMPVAAPVRQVVHRISEKRKEAVGLVQRHVLRTLYVMKGACAEELDDVVAIGADRVERMLARISQHNSEVKRRKNGTYAISSKGLAQLEEGGYDSIVEHKRRFTVNGVTGDLLPIEFWGNHEACELFCGQRGDFALRGGNRINRLWALPGNPQATGNTAIDVLMDERDLAIRRVLGIPDAGVARISSTPASVTGDSWVLAFLLVLTDGTLCCYSAGNPPERLRLCGKTERDYVELLRPRLFDEVAADEFIDDDRLQLAPTSEPGVKTVTVIEPRITLSHNAYNSDTQAASRDLATKLTMPILAGEIWLPSARWAYLRLLPGDKATAERICVLRGIRRLQNFLASVDAANVDKVNIQAWWKLCQDEYFASIPSSVRPDPIPFSLLRDQILGEAEDGAPPVPDTAFLERFDCCLGKSHNNETGVVIKGYTASRLLVNGMEGMNITETLLTMLNNAEESVSLISPMCEDARIVSLLNSIGRRDVRLLTEIRERTKGHNPEFWVRKWQRLDREGGGGLNHVRKLRALVQNSVFCRGTRGYPHAKLAIVDEKAVLISSANLSPNSLGGGDGYSYEAGLYIEDDQIVACFRTLFNTLWDASPIRQHMVSGDVSITEEASIPVDPCALHQDVGDGLLLCANFPPRHAFLTDAITQCLREAKEEATVVALSVYDTRDIPRLHAAIRDALSRGVRVRFIVREDHGFGSKWPDPSTLELQDKGMRIETRVGLHAKGLLVDNAYCGIFSANVNPFSLDPTLPTAHVEIGLFGPANHSVIEPYAEFLRSL